MQVLRKNKNLNKKLIQYIILQQEIVQSDMQNSFFIDLRFHCGFSHTNFLKEVLYRQQWPCFLGCLIRICDT